MRRLFGLLALLSACLPLSAITHIRQLLNVAGPGTAPASGYILIQANKPFRTAGGVAVTVTAFKYDLPSTGILDILLQPNIGSTPSDTFYTAEFRTNGAVSRETWRVPDTGTLLDLSAIQVSTVPSTAFMLNLSQLSPLGPDGYGLQMAAGVPTWLPATSNFTCSTYTVSTSAGNWMIATNRGTPATGPAISGATTQAIPLFNLGASGEIKSVSLHTTVTFAGSSFTTIKATIGDSVGGATTYTSLPYELTETAANTNFQKALMSKSASYAGSTVQLQLTANQNLNSSTLTGALDIGVCVSNLP